MKRLRFGLLFLIVALYLPVATALSQTDHNADAQKTEQPEAIKPDAKPEGPPPSAHKPERSTEERGKHEEHCEYRGPAWFSGFYCFFALHDKFWVAFGTLILAVGTAILGFATVFLWRATRQLVLDAKEASQKQFTVSVLAANAAKETADTAKTQAEVARDTLFTMRAQLRAYLVVEADTIEDFETGRVTMGRFWIRNVGQTPPRDVIMATGVEVVPRGQIPTFDAPPADDLRAEPNARSANFFEQILTTKAATRVFRQDEIDAVLADRSRVCVGGRVYYKDIFGDEWRTDFLYVYSGPETRTMIPQQYQSGNRAT
ncbi:hypothetical protein [Bradyrhizobium sp. JYMT SZCCT0180]|uniref:hypothetical protein n=1 Tax=Bradyrhizobium sp. JYMT SZCCT0180 TaxID=2807666 RepID=UPI001BAA2AA5|nr:hypothetical protein [Bradyrhizobium sp. JYMT SZCCT0180]MBR1212005.1 hypothetical protein [Bradyrhizobium sp. JYMT SZCCT0180]